MDSSDRSRRNFVKTVATTTAIATSIAATQPLAARAEAASPQPSPLPEAERARLREVYATVPFPFDRDAFRAILERPYPHRQIVAATSYIGAGVGMSHLQNSLLAYADPNGFAAGPNGLHIAMALYGNYSYNTVLNDAMYAKYPIGLISDEAMRPNDTSYRTFWTNLKINPSGSFVKTLADRGASFFVCNKAFMGLVSEIAKRTTPAQSQITREQVIAIHDELAANFLPGTMLVPAGVAAVNAAQEAKFTFLPE